MGIQEAAPKATKPTWPGVLLPAGGVLVGLVAVALIFVLGGRAARPKPPAPAIAAPVAAATTPLELQQPPAAEPQQPAPAVQTVVAPVAPPAAVSMTPELPPARRTSPARGERPGRLAEGIRWHNGTPSGDSAAAMAALRRRAVGERRSIEEQAEWERQHPPMTPERQEQLERLVESFRPLQRMVDRATERQRDMREQAARELAATGRPPR